MQHGTDAGARWYLHTRTHSCSCAHATSTPHPALEAAQYTYASEHLCDRSLAATKGTVACARRRHNAMRLQYGAGAELAATIGCAGIALVPHVWCELRLAKSAVSSHRLVGAREGEPSKRSLFREGTLARCMCTIFLHQLEGWKRAATPISFSDHSACHQAVLFCAGVIIEPPILHRRCG